MKSLNEINEALIIINETLENIGRLRRRAKEDIVNISSDIFMYTSRVDMSPEEKVLYDEVVNHFSDTLNDSINI